NSATGMAFGLLSWFLYSPISALMICWRRLPTSPRYIRRRPMEQRALAPVRDQRSDPGGSLLARRRCGRRWTVHGYARERLAAFDSSALEPDRRSPRRRCDTKANKERIDETESQPVFERGCDRGSPVADRLAGATRRAADRAGWRHCRRKRSRRGSQRPERARGWRLGDRGDHRPTH